MVIVQLITALDGGGADQVLLDLCRGLIARGHIVHLGVLKSNRILSEPFESLGIQIRQFHLNGPLAYPAILFKVAAWLRRLCPDVIHTHLFKADVIGAAAKMVTPGARLICTKHNEDQYLRHPAYAMLCRLAASRCDAIITVSEAVARFLSDTTGVSPEKTHTVTPGVTRVQLRHRNFSEACSVGIVGRLTPQKGHEYLLRSVAELPADFPMHLKIIGTGEEENRLRNLSENVGISSRVRFHGYMKCKDEIYQGIDVLVLPSLWEGAGLVLLEAMSRGIPVIASRVGGIPEFVNDGSGWLVPSGDIHALKEALVQAVTMEDLYKAKSLCAFNSADEFPVNGMVQKYSLLYQKVSSDLVAAMPGVTYS